MKRFILLCFIPFVVKAQFAPAAGMAGTTAIKKDSSIIIGWATGCKIARGWQDVSNQSMGYTTVGDSSSAIGVADGINVVSLGDGGSAILTFQLPIKNGPGPDFCVFENSFDPGFLELAFVEVSSDGINFTRFAPTSNNQNTLQIGPFDTNSDPTKLNNLAGKYIGGYGVPFDLQELVGTPELNTDNITHVKIVDVVGCVQQMYATYDKNNNAINDPWATAFASGGFDLDAVGVINQEPAGLKEQTDLKEQITIFPAITDDKIFVQQKQPSLLFVEVLDINGKIVKTKQAVEVYSEMSLVELESGVYLIRVSDGTGHMFKKIIRK